MITVATIPVGKGKDVTLFVEVRNAGDPHLAIRREGGGLVRIEAHEVRHLTEALTLAASDLAALASIKDW